MKNPIVIAVALLVCAASLGAAPGSQAATDQPMTGAQSSEPVVPHLSAPARTLPRSARTVEAPVAMPDLLTGIESVAGTEPTAGPIQRRLPQRAPSVTSFPGQGYAPLRPPDPTGEADDTYFVQAINGMAGATVAVYQKSDGTKVSGPWNMGSLWSPTDPCATEPWGDPIVQYDQLADRWVLSQGGGYSGPPYYQCVAVSQTDDPMGSYYTYSFSLGNLFGDYPKLSVWPDAYYVTVRDFADATTWEGPSVWALQRDAMLIGDPALGWRFDLSTDYEEVIAADVDGPASPYYYNLPVLAISDVTDEITMWTVMVDWSDDANSGFSAPVTIPVNPYTAHYCADERKCLGQPGTAQTLDSLSRHLMYRLAYRNFGSSEMMALTHTVDADTTKTKFRWYTFERLTGDTEWALTDQGTFGPDAANRWTPSVAIDSAGGLGIVYNVVDTTAIYPSAAVTGRSYGDPPGSLGAGEAIAAAGLSAQPTSGSGHRWGDYNHISVDPADNCRFWFTAEHTAEAGQWATVIGSFSRPDCPNKEWATTTVRVSGGYATKGTTPLFHPKDKVKVRVEVDPLAPNHMVNVNFARWDKGSGTWVVVVSTYARLNEVGTLAIMRKASTLGKRGKFGVAADYLGDQDTNPDGSEWMPFKIVPP